MRWGSEVHFVVLTVVVGVEEGYAEVVEVEADAGWKLAEPVAMAVEVVEQEHRVLPEVLQCFVGRLVEQAHGNFSLGPLAGDGGMAAAALQVALLPPCVPGEHDGAGLQVVGEAQQEVQSLAPAQTHSEGEPAVELAIGIEGMPLVDDVGDEAEGEGAVHAVAAAVAESLHPDEGIGQFFHVAATKLTLFWQTSNREQEIIHYI